MSKVYVITGGTGGMGLAIAKKLRRDDTILLADISKERLESVKQTFMQDGYKNIHTIACNVSNKEDVGSLAELAKELGEISILIHTAGVSPASFSARDIMSINLRGTVLILDAFESLIKKGSVAVCIASMSGYTSPYNQTLKPILDNPLDSDFLDKITLAIQDSAALAYSLSKKAVLELVEQRGSVWGKNGGRIVSVSPGLIWTPMGKKEAENPNTTKMMKDLNPMGRFGEPEEIANAVAFLISEEASYINGTDLRVDGGVTPLLKKELDRASV